MPLKDYLPEGFPAEKEPDGDVSAPHHIYPGVILTWFAFQYIWPYYPEIGAILTLLGVGITLDDVVSHAFGIATPLDYIWKKVIYQWVK